MEKKAHNERRYIRHWICEVKVILIHLTEICENISFNRKIIRNFSTAQIVDFSTRAQFFIGIFFVFFLQIEILPIYDGILT